MDQQSSFLLEIRLNEGGQDSRLGYDNLYERTSLSQIQSFYLWIIKQVELPTHGKFLDVACGAGELVRLAGLRGFQAFGLDISEVVARAATQNVQSHGWIGVSHGESIPFANGYFDCVTNIGSLEHFQDPAQGAQEMARVLSPLGRAYILVPNTFSLLSNVWNAFRKGITSIDHQPIQRYGARMDWVNLLEANGLHVIKTIKFERVWPQKPSDWGFYFRHPKQMVRLFASPFIPLNLSYAFIFVCRKRFPSRID
jgi:SAM-dependent methyltransferase